MESFLVDNYFDNIVQNVFHKDLLIYSSGLTTIYGPPKQGKSTLALWQMRQLLKRGAIKTFVYIDLDSKSKVQQKSAYDMSIKEGWEYITTGMVRQKYKNKTLFTLDIISILIKKGITHFLIDTWGSMIEHIPENDASAIKPVSNALRDLAVENGLSIVLIGHTGKNLSLGMRGSSEIRGAVTFSLLVAKDEATKNIIVSVVDDSESAMAGDQYVLKILTRVKGIASVDLTLTKLNQSVNLNLTPQEKKELKLNQQRKFLTSWIAKYLSQLKTNKVRTSILRDVVLRNINRLENMSNKSQDHEDYCPTRMVKAEYSNLLETTFSVISEKNEETGGYVKYVVSIEAEDFLKHHKGITKLPEIYIRKGHTHLVRQWDKRLEKPTDRGVALFSLIFIEWDYLRLAEIDYFLYI